MRRKRGSAIIHRRHHDGCNSIDVELTLRNVNAMAELSRAYLANDYAAQQAAKAKLSPRMRWEVEQREERRR